VVLSIEHGSYLAIVIFLLLTGCGLPIPEEVPIVLSGVVSSQGRLEPLAALLACVVGALLGDSAMYGIGYHFGRRLLSLHPKLGKLMGAEREEYFEQSVQRHLFKVMFFSRFLVGVRAPVYLAAGVTRVSYRKFLLCDLVCATVVVATFFSLAYFFGDHILRLIREVEMQLTLVAALAALFTLLWWLRKKRQPAIDEALVRHAAKDGKKDPGESSPQDPA
jgi:membrane protein DedA with SNARE-associated domain